VKKFITFLIAAAFAALPLAAQQNRFVSAALNNADGAQTSTDAPSKGRAPQQENGIGIADVRVFDESGKPLQGVYVHLRSRRSDGFECESWNWTDANGFANLKPIHMGQLTFDVNGRDDINKTTLKGYRKARIEYSASDLNNVVRVVLPKK
jgi:hypothetical protein